RPTPVGPASDTMEPSPAPPTVRRHTPEPAPAPETTELASESAMLNRMMGTWVNADADLLVSAAELHLTRTGSGATGRMTLTFRLGGQLEERVVGNLTDSGELALRITGAHVVGNEQATWPLMGQSVVFTYDAERDVLDG